jgi:uncharacterized protein (DUF58 family)
VLDASIELWAGPEGRAPLDVGVEEVAALAARHLRRGDHVGLVVAASRLRSWIPPAAGPVHAAKIAGALASAASMVDADRSELDEVEVAQRVAEHARPLDPRGLSDIPKGDLDALARRADALRSRAPFAPRLPFARSAREQSLRHYVAAFGIELPPRMDGEREHTEVAVAQVFEKLATDKPRPSVVHVWAPAPGPQSPIVKGIRKLRSRRTEVRWTTPPFELGVGLSADLDGAPPPDVQAAIDEAVRVRARAARARGERLLRHLGVRSVGAAAKVVRLVEPSPPSSRTA